MSMSRERTKNQFQRRSLGSPWLVLGGALLAGCFVGGCDDGKTSGAGGAGAVGGAGALGGAGGTAVDVPGVVSPALAVMTSDYSMTSSVSLYNPATGKLVDGCAKSGAATAVVVSPLSGNVGLPTQAQLGGKLVLIDSTTATLTFVDPSTCVATAQLSVSTGGFKSNPHDVVTLSSTKAYVTRYETNAAPTPALTDFDEGDDVLIVDPTLLTVTNRIALAPFATPGTGGVATQARPDRALLAGGLVYVTLNSISGDFAATGPGRLVVIDPTTDTVTGMIDLPDQKNCSGMTYLAAQKKLYVVCGGAYGDAAQVDQSALVEIDLSGVTPVVARTVQAATLGTDPLNFFYAAVSGDIAYVGTLGAYPTATTPGTADAFYAVALTSGVAVKLATSGNGNLGNAVVDPTSKKVFLPDGDGAAPLVHVFDISTGTPTALVGFEADPSAHLPPRGIAWY